MAIENLNCIVWNLREGVGQGGWKDMLQRPCTSGGEGDRGLDNYNNVYYNNIALSIVHIALYSTLYRTYSTA